MILRWLFFLLGLSGPVAGQLTELDTVRSRVIASLTESTVDTARVLQIAGALDPNGQWPDIDYQDTSRTGFQHGTHLNRMNALAIAYRQPPSPLYGDERLATAIDHSLNHWLAEDYLCANWWWNQIGTPWRLVDLYLVMDQALAPTQLQAVAPIIGRANLGAWGARPGGDLIKIAGILGKDALLRRDSATLQRAVTAMAGEIGFAVDRGTPDDLRGMQTDFGFHHRDDRVTSIQSYGLGYANAFAEWAAFLGGSRYAFPREATELLVDFYLDGIAATMPFGAFPDPGVKNRGLSRPGDLKLEGSKIPRNLLLATAYRADELERLLSVRSGGGLTANPRNKFFYSSEYMAHQQPHYFASVRMYSDRNHSVEVPYNGEGIKNHYLADGANWLTKTGSEYTDIFPVLDYRKIPGTTVVQKPALPGNDEIQQRGLTDFVGGVTDGTYGAAAFDLVSPLDSLAAHKAWFFFADEYVCLGAGIRSADPFSVATTIDQRWLDGKVIREPGYIWHAGTAYHFSDSTQLNLTTDTVSGRWSDINVQSDSPREVISGEVFKLWIDHGTKPTNATYAYTVTPNADRRASQSKSDDSPIRILPNTEEVQAVGHEGLGLYQFVFYSTGSIELPGGLTIGLSAPGMLMLHRSGSKITSLTVADPTHKLAALEVTLTKKLATSYAAKGLTYDAGRGTTTVTVGLPQGNFAGKSVTVKF